MLAARGEKTDVGQIFVGQISGRISLIIIGICLKRRQTHKFFGLG